MGGMLVVVVLFLLIEAMAVMGTETARNLNVALAPNENRVRRLGNHRQSEFMISRPPCISPSEPPSLPAMDNVSNKHDSEGVMVISSSNHQEHSTTTTQEPQQSAQDITIKKGKHRHHSVDKSVAGGGVILGGLATTLLVAIACYIRATRRKKVEPTSPSSASSPTSSKV